MDPQRDNTHDTDDAPVLAELVVGAGTAVVAEGAVLHGRTPLAERRVRSGISAALVFHLALAGVAATLATTLDLRIAAFGSARPLSITAAFSDEARAVDAPDESGPEQAVVITPTEAWQDDRHYVNTTVSPSVDHPAELPARTTPQPQTDKTRQDRPTEAAPPRVARRPAAPPRRRAAASVEPAIAPVALPPPDIRFVGRPCRYPAVLLGAGWEGEVVLRIKFDADGTVTHVAIEKSSGYAVVDAEALQTVRTWRAAPNKPGGKLAAGEVLKPIKFLLRRDGF